MICFAMWTRHSTGRNAGPSLHSKITVVGNPAIPVKVLDSKTNPATSLYCLYEEKCALKGPKKNTGEKCSNLSWDPGWKQETFEWQILDLKIQIDHCVVLSADFKWPSVAFFHEQNSMVQDIWLQEVAKVSRRRSNGLEDCSSVVGALNSTPYLPWCHGSTSRPKAVERDGREDMNKVKLTQKKGLQWQYPGSVDTQDISGRSI